MATADDLATHTFGNLPDLVRVSFFSWSVLVFLLLLLVLLLLALALLGGFGARACRAACGRHRGRLRRASEAAAGRAAPGSFGTGTDGVCFGGGGWLGRTGVPLGTGIVGVCFGSAPLPFGSPWPGCLGAGGGSGLPRLLRLVWPRRGRGGIVPGVGGIGLVGGVTGGVGRFGSCCFGAGGSAAAGGSAGPAGGASACGLLRSGHRRRRRFGLAARSLALRPRRDPVGRRRGRRGRPRRVHRRLPGCFGGSCGFFGSLGIGAGVGPGGFGGSFGSGLALRRVLG